MHLGEAAEAVRKSFSETLAHAEFPHEHWHRITADNTIEQLIAGIAG